MGNTSSLLLTNGIIVSPYETRAQNILIEHGTIKAMLGPNDTTKTEHVVDISGLHVFPGLIDTHVHFRTPGAEHKEDWESGSRAAAAGGITTVIDMPNTTPPTTTAERLAEKRVIAGTKSVVNFGFFLGVDQMNPDIPAHPGNIAGIKLYLDTTTGNYKIEDEKFLKKIFSTKDHFALHAESETFERIMKMLEPTGNPVHLCHANTAHHLQTARHYKQRGYPLTVEVCPHHLFLNTRDLTRLKGYGMVKPPLPTPKDQQELWAGIEDGTINTIATDHAPHTNEEKESNNPPFGVPGLETSLALMLNAVNQKRLALTKVVELMCENPAKTFGIRNKGMIKEGYDADLTVVDMRLEREVANKNLFTKCGWSPFAGIRLKGWPVKTFVNGMLIYENENVVNIKKKRGKEVRFASFSPP